MPKPNEGLRISAAEYKQWQNRPTEPLSIYRTAFTISNVLRDRVKQQQRNAVWFEWHYSSHEGAPAQPHAIVALSPYASLPMIRMYGTGATGGLRSYVDVTEFSPFRNLRHVSVHGTGRSVMLNVTYVRTHLRTEPFDDYKPGPEYLSACWHLNITLGHQK